MRLRTPISFRLFRGRAHQSTHARRFPMILRLLFSFFILVVLMPAGLTVWFLYEQWYFPLLYSSDVLLLESQLAIQVVDIPRYERVKKWLETRAAPSPSNPPPGKLVP